MKTKTILATCYAVNPYKGSEDGMGWNYVIQIARFNKIIAVTRENNKSHIESFISENPSELYKNITFLYFDLPYWMRFWKKGGRVAMLYYYLWQKNVIAFIRKQNKTYDIVHNLNFHNDWTPTFLYKLNKPLVWGPIGHHPVIPSQYLTLYDKKYFFIDRITWIIKKTFWNLSISLKKSVRNSNHIICMNTKVPNSINLQKTSFSIRPSIASEDLFEGKIKSKKKFQIISVGRFVPLKGFDLTLLSYIRFINSLPIQERNSTELILIGSGPEKKLYTKIIEEHNVENYIKIIDWIDRNKLMKLYKKASVFLFPSHEGAGMVVAEALSFGLPVICLNNEGPGEFINDKCGFAVNQLDYNSTIIQLKNALFKLYSNKELLLTMSKNARKHYEENFTWNSRGNHLNDIYNQL